MVEERRIDVSPPPFRCVFAAWSCGLSFLLQHVELLACERHVSEDVGVLWLQEWMFGISECCLEVP